MSTEADNQNLAKMLSNAEKELEMLKVEYEMRGQYIDLLRKERDRLKVASDSHLSDNAGLLNLIADIRAAVGDKEGILMQDELVEHCRVLADQADLPHDHFDVIRKLHKRRN